MEKTALEALTWRHAFLRRVCNTFLRAPWLFNLLTLRRWSSLDAGYWAERTVDGKRGIKDYVDLAPTSLPLLAEVEVRAAGNRDAVILDLGCNVGRHLNALRERGFRNLHGVDVNATCGAEVGKIFPELAQSASLTWASFQAYLPSVPDGFFDIVFTHGKTIEHMTPRFRIADELARVCRGWLVLGNVGFSTGSYPRFWIYELERSGFALVKLLQPEWEWAPDSPVNRPHSLAVFRRIPSGEPPRGGEEAA